MCSITDGALFKGRTKHHKGPVNFASLNGSQILCPVKALGRTTAAAGIKVLKVVFMVLDGEKLLGIDLSQRDNSYHRNPIIEVKFQLAVRLTAVIDVSG